MTTALLIMWSGLLCMIPLVFVVRWTQRRAGVDPSIIRQHTELMAKDVFGSFVWCTVVTAVALLLSLLGGVEL